MFGKVRHHLGLEQSQQLRLLPMQVQVGRLLEMNSLEIEEEVKRALDELPALESADDAKKDSRDDTPDHDDSFNETAEEIQLADYANEDDIPVFKRNQATYDPDSFYEPVAVNPESTLWETLTQQLREQNLSDGDERIAFQKC